MAKNTQKKEGFNQYFILFRYGECPSGKYQYSVIYEKTKQRAWSVALEKYGNFAPYSILTPRMFNKSTVKALGATLFETIRPSDEKVEGYDKYMVERRVG